MSLSVTCPACAASFGVPPTVVGKVVLCPRCRRPLALGGTGGPPARSVMPLVGILAGVLVFLGGAAALVVFALSTGGGDKREQAAGGDQPPGASADASEADPRTKVHTLPAKDTVPPQPAPVVPQPVRAEPKPVPAEPKREPVVPKPAEPKAEPKPEPRPEPPPKPKPQPKPAAPWGATVVATYRFQDTLAADEKGVPALIPTNPLRKNGFETATVFGKPRRVYRFTGRAMPVHLQAGLTFDNRGGLLPVNNYSVEMIFVFLQADNRWRRIVDAQDRQSDNGFYAAPDNRLQIYPFPSVGKLLTAGTYRHVVLAVESTGVAKAYLDAGLQFTAKTEIMNINNPRKVLHLFLDNTVGPGQYEYSNGKIAFLRLYKGVLTQDQAAGLSSAAHAGPSAAADKPAEDKPAAKDADADPGNLEGLPKQVGKVYYFRVTGSTTGSVYGTGVYTTDSALATAAVHAGVLRPGETGVVRVRLVAGRSSYAGSTRNGVTSGSWNSYPTAYTVSRAARARRDRR